MAPVLALASALSFGVADFLGGVATRRAHPLTITVLSQAVGAALLVVAVPLAAGTFHVDALLWGGLAGLGGAGGLVCYLRALAIGPMGVTAPIAAVVGAAVPVAVGLGAGERPTLPALLGVAAGVLATALVTRSSGAELARTTARLRAGVLSAVAAGGLFGLFFVALDGAPSGTGLWPLVGARITGLLLLAILLAGRRPARPPAVATRTALVSGGLDMMANVLFLMATRQGLLVLTAVLTSLYPVVVVLLAHRILRERLEPTQWTGVALAVTAVALIAA